MAGERALIVSFVPTHAPDAGNRVRLLSLAEQLGRLGLEVHFAHVERWKGDPAAMGAFWGDRLARIPWVRPPRVARRLRRERLLRRLGYFRPHRVDDWYDPGLDAPLRALRERVRPQIVVVNYVFLSKAFEAFPGAFKVLDTQDVFTDRHRISLRSGEEPHFFYTTRRQERRALDRADAVMAIQEEEAAFFRTLTRRPVVTVGHAVRLRELPEAGDGTILFLASENPANVHGLRFLLDEVLPLVRAVRPPRLLLAGAICNRAPDAPGIEKLGRVADVADAQRRADVVVCPVLLGTGLKVKVVEALGCGRPVVATRHAVRGLEVGPEDGVVVADDAAGFARGVLRLVGDADARRRASRAAAAFAARYNEGCFEQLRALLALRTRRG